MFRAARNTDDLETIKDFYHMVLNLEVLGSFDNEEEYSGIYLGQKGENWHLEFTQNPNGTKREFDEDDLWVFYPSSLQEYDSIIENLKEFGISLRQAKNPYWNGNGVMFQDPDGFNIVVSNLRAF